MIPFHRALRAPLAVAVLVGTGCGGGGTGNGPPAPPPNPALFVDGEPYRPAIDPADFVARIDNPYLPFLPGTTLVYRGASEGERERVVVHVTDQTKEILGVTATVVRDRVYQGGELVEDTFDWFAQDRFGNVWYLGEDTEELEGGEVVSREGSWEAGVDGAQPGIVMPGEPRIGETYRQEFYRGEAEDVGRVIRLGATVDVPEGSFDGVLVTEDWTPLEPRIREHKYYAKGVGVVLERRVRGGHEVLRLVARRTP